MQYRKSMITNLPIPVLWLEMVALIVVFLMWEGNLLMWGGKGQVDPAPTAFNRNRRLFAAGQLVRGLKGLLYICQQMEVTGGDLVWQNIWVINRMVTMPTNKMVMTVMMMVIMPMGQVTPCSGARLVNRTVLALTSYARFTGHEYRMWWWWSP